MGLGANGKGRWTGEEIWKEHRSQVGQCGAKVIGGQMWQAGRGKGARSSQPHNNTVSAHSRHPRQTNQKNNKQQTRKLGLTNSDTVDGLADVRCVDADVNAAIGSLLVLSTLFPDAPGALSAPPLPTSSGKGPTSSPSSASSSSSSSCNGSLSTRSGLSLHTA